MAMNILVTDSNIEYRNFRKIISVDSLAGITKIDNFVYHRSADAPQRVIDILRKLEMKSITYLRDGDLMDESLKLYIRGLGGKLVEDEFYLSSSDAMENLTDALKTGTELMSTNSLEVLENFYSRIASGETDFSKPYMKNVKSATEKIKKGFTKKDNELQSVFKTAVEMFDSVSTDLSSVRSANKELRDQAEEIQHRMENVKNTSSQTDSRIYHYSSVRYKERSPVIVIKEIGDVAFLLSFTMGLMHYMIQKQSLNTRLIIVLPVGENYEKIYGENLPEDTDFITHTNHGSKSRYQSKITYTNHPTASVMNKLFRSNFDSYIVLDRSKTSANNIVMADTGNKFVKSYTAVQSNRIFTKFPKLNRGKSFSSLVSAKGTMFTIPLIEDYGTKVPRRVHTYLDVCGDMYQKLTSGVS